MMRHNFISPQCSFDDVLATTIILFHDEVLTSTCLRLWFLQPQLFSRTRLSLQ